MKNYLQAWYRGIGVFGLYLCLSLVASVLGWLTATLPFIGLPILLLAGPPVFYWIFRWLYPEAAEAKIRLSVKPPVPPR